MPTRPAPGSASASAATSVAASAAGRSSGDWKRPAVGTGNRSLPPVSAAKVAVVAEITGCCVTLTSPEVRVPDGLIATSRTGAVEGSAPRRYWNRRTGKCPYRSRGRSRRRARKKRLPSAANVRPPTGSTFPRPSTMRSGVPPRSTRKITGPVVSV